MTAVETPMSTAAGAHWVEPGLATQETVDLARALGQPVWFAHLLSQRGLSTKSEVQSYLTAEIGDLHDPFLMHGMQAAVDRVLQAIKRRQSILVYGDYDVDGTTATVLLKTAIDRVTPVGVASLARYHIPHRIQEGYGMQASVLAAAADAGVQLVISVDTGIRAFAAADEAAALGLDLIVTDHHLPDGNAGVPKAVAVLNPNQAGCTYPFKDLCGAAVAFKLSHALLRAACTPPQPADAYRQVDPISLQEKLLPSLLKLVSIATVADAVPLTGENRAIASMGLRALASPRQHGLRALMEVAGVDLGSTTGPSATEVAFRIAPRINAAGRMDVATDAVRLLLTRELSEGRVLADKLHRLNEERRATEAAVLDVLEEEIDRLQRVDGALAAAGCLVLDGEGWHRGVIGILASRVVERTGRPALVVAHEDGIAHGSGRSVSGFNLLDALSAIHAEGTMPLFDRFGGHAHAVGFALPSVHLPALRERMSTYAAPRLSPQQLTPKLTIDAHLTLQELSGSALPCLQLLAPFGHGNEEPRFMTARLTVAEAPRILKDRHIKLRLRDAEGAVATCLGWSRALQWPARLAELRVQAGSLVDVMYRVRENRHPQFGGAEMELCDLRLSATSQRV